MSQTKNSNILAKLLASAVLSVLLGCTAASQNPEAEKLDHSADLMRASGNDSGAADIYQSAILLDANDTIAHKSLGEILEAHGDIKNAELQYAAALKNRPDDIDLLREHAKIELKLGRPGDARDEYEKIQLSHPNDVKTLNGLGIALDYLGQHSAAQQSYRTALDADPADLVTLNNLAHSYVLTGAYDPAIRLLEPHAKDRAATPALRQNLAEAYSLNGMDADAERMLLMDLPLEKTKRDLDFYRAERLKLGLIPAFYADLGMFSTYGIADARAQMLRMDFAPDLKGLTVKVASNLSKMGGTPDFNVAVVGFRSMERLKRFCQKLESNSTTCHAKTNQ